MKQLSEWKKELVVLFAIVLGLTLLDIFVVETFYRPTADWGNIWKYHYLYWMLIVALPLIGAYFTKSLIPLLTYILFFFGVEDTLFYGLQGYLPEIYWGVSVAGVWQPTLNTVLALNVAGMAICVALWFIYRTLREAKKQK